MSPAELAIGIATGVSPLVTNCATLLGYIQHARHLERDYDTYYLRFEAANVRLMRWGEAFDIDKNSCFAPKPTESTNSEGQLARSIFQQIRKLLERTNKLLKRYEKLAEAAAAGDPRGVDFLRRIAWAVCDRKELEELATQVAALVDNLEQLYPIKWYTLIFSRLRMCMRIGAA